jgi:uncharacterized protein (TIGR03083 family)
MATDPAPLIEALRNSHERLQSLVEPLGAGELERPSYASEWSIAQVLSHLGSQAEIFGLFLDAGMSQQDPPGPEAFPPIWEAWNTRSPQHQAADGLTADAAVTERFESLDAGQQERLRLKLFGRDLDTAGLAQMRLSEHAVHTWDVAVALDPDAGISADAVGLLVDQLGRIAARGGKPDGTQLRVRVSTSDPERRFTLAIGDAVTIEAASDGDDEGLPELLLPAEAFIRLIYGRLDPAHTPELETRGVDLDQLRQIFPGF